MRHFDDLTQAQTPQTLWLLRFVAVAMATVLLLVTAFCTWQAWLGYAQKRDLAALQKAQQTMAAKISDEFKQRLQQVDDVLQDAKLRTLIASDEAAHYADAADRAMFLLPNMQHIEFFSPHLEEVLEADFRIFGYTRAARLIEALDDKEPPQVMVVNHDDSVYTSIIQSLDNRHTGKVEAYAWFAWPFSQVLNVMHALMPSRGMLQLQEGAGTQYVSLARLGDGVANEHSHQLPIAKSNLWLLSGLPERMFFSALAWQQWSLAAAIALLMTILVWLLRRYLEQALLARGD